MEYEVHFGLYDEEEHPISDEVRERLIDAWIEAVEAEGLYTGGGIRVMTKLDFHLAGLWMFLWRWVPYLRREL